MSSLDLYNQPEIYEADEVFYLSENTLNPESASNTESPSNTLEGEWPDRFYSQINQLALHYFKAKNFRAKSFKAKSFKEKSSTSTQARAKALVYAGGGYMSLMHDKEGVEVALWLTELGIDAYVVTHRLPGMANEKGGVYPSDIALQDGLACLQFLSERDSLPLLHVGLSSGGHLAGVMACQTDIIKAQGVVITYAPINANHRNYKAPKDKPDYPPIEKQEFYDAWAIGIENEAHGVPQIPVFLAYPLHDQAVPIDHALNLIKTAHSLGGDGLGGDVEVHIYPQAPHGFALRDKNGTHDQWHLLAQRWFERLLG